jgi:hypothetical protein
MRFGIDLLLGFLGYVKIPKEAVLIMLRLEDFMKMLKRNGESKISPEKLGIIEQHLMATKTLREFLITGRMLQ